MPSVSSRRSALAGQFDDLDAVAVDVLVEPVLIDGIRDVHRGLRVPRLDEHEHVFDPRVRVVADAADHEEMFPVRSWALS